MANVVVCALSNTSFTEECYKDCFVEQLINSFIRNGNNVLYIPYFRMGYSKHSEAQIKSKLVSFRPNLVIAFNNALPSKNLFEFLDVPILSYASDTTHFWLNKEAILKNIDRYWFASVSAITANEIQNTLNPHPDRNFVIGYATDMRAESIEQDIPISFVGSIANFSPNTTKFWDRIIDHIPDWAEKDRIKTAYFHALDQFSADTSTDMQFNINQYLRNVDICSKDRLNQETVFLLTCRERFKTLSALAEVGGLTIFGYPNQWPTAFQFDYNLFRCFTFQPSITFKQNLRTYNRSIVSLNLYHANHTDGFSWRVCDILASNAVLLSNKKKDLETLTKGYVDLPMYESSSEAKQLAKKLLGDKVLRTEICDASHRMINDKCRFERYLQIINERISNIKLSISDKQEGILEELSLVPRTDSDSLLDKIAYKFTKHFSKILVRKGIIYDPVERK